MRMSCIGLKIVQVVLFNVSKEIPNDPNIYSRCNIFLERLIDICNNTCVHKFTISLIRNHAYY